MKKKIIIIITCLIIIAGVITFILLNNRVASIITMDINPSIEINLDKEEKVIKVKAINDDAKSIVSNEYNNKTLEEALTLLVTNLISENYVEDNNVDIILHTEGNIKIEDITQKIEFTFGKEEVHPTLTIINDITKEDEKLAKKYHINPAKAAYINSITKEIASADIETLAAKPVRELIETKDFGRYCDKDYTLEGSWCLKEIGRTEAEPGKICQEGYYEYNDKCYEETAIIEKDNLTCREDFKLNDTECTRIMTIDATPTKYTCEKGEAKTMLELGLTNADAGNANDVVCVDYSNATHPVSPCELPANDPTERTFSGGKCYWHKAPIIAEGCPGKIQVNGFCWDDASNIHICAGYRDGKQYKSKSEYCEHSINYLKPTVTEYSCPKDYTLNGNKCEKEEKEDAMHERTCPSNYTLINNDKCINYNKTSEKVDGYICNKENTKLKDKTCIIYDMVEAKQ